MGQASEKVGGSAQSPSAKPSGQDTDSERTSDPVDETSIRKPGASATIEWPGRQSQPWDTPIEAKDVGASPGPVPGIPGAEPPFVPQSSYVIIEEVARGGRGRILKALDRRLGRSVALKEILHGGSESAQRFLREALITANLQHPAIVPVYEAGYWTSGAPFYAMKMVSGRSLQEVIEHTTTLNERLALLPNLIAVADAIAYAHSQGIIHRDLKPANVLVGAFGETVVVDWGLAKNLAEADASEAPVPPDVVGASDLTIVGTVMGTPAYMSPEQAKGLGADKRGDVYALGAMLYHLLAGDSPYVGSSGQEVLKKVVLGSPPPPLEQIQPQVPRDLAAIVHKAMAIDPADRYPTANELSEDLKRFQTGQLVSAHEYSTWSLFARWVWRHRVTVTVATGLLLALAVTAAVSVQRIIRERNRAERQRAEAQAARQQAETRTNELILMQARELLDRDPTTTIAWLKTYPISVAGWGAVRVIAADAYERGIAKRVLRGHQSNVNAIAFLPDRKRIASASFDKTLRIWNLITPEVQVLSGHQDIVRRIALSPDGKQLASASGDRTARIWDVNTGLSQILQGQGYVFCLAFSPDGRQLAFGDDKTVRLWDVASGESRMFAGHTGRVESLGFSPDGKLLASAGDSTVRVWDLGTGEGRIVSRYRSATNSALFSSDGRYVISCSDDHTIQVWDSQTDKSTVIHGHDGKVEGVVLLPRGKGFASASEDGTARLWSFEGQSVQVFKGHQSPVRCVTPSSDGQTLASGAADGTVQLWDVVAGTARVLLGHTSEVAALRFSSGDDSLASASWDDTVRIWDLTQLRTRIFREKSSVRHLAFSPDGAYAAWTAEDSIGLLDLKSGKTTRFTGHKGAVNRVEFSPQGRALASASADDTIRLWDLNTGAARVMIGHAMSVNSVAFAPDGKTVASVSDDRTVRLWSADTGSSRTLGSHNANVDQVVFSPDGRLLASGARDATVRVWNLQTGHEDALWSGSSKVRHLAFSPSGSLLAWGGDAVYLWDSRTGRQTTLTGHGSYVADLAFLGEDRLLSGSRDKRLMMWDLSSGNSRVFHGHQSQVTSLSLAADGKRFVSANWDSTVRIWDLETGESRVLRGHQGNVNFVAYSPDGNTVASAGADGTVRFWRDDLPTEPNALHAWMNGVTDATVANKPVGQ